jgi:class 3 adenylate cyclase/tRNA A-37 threonylcarbamoyl transferase component Bud32/tetratricopeptide (TPR) repeat protein
VQPDRIGPYRLEEQIGSGGMGVVYRAYDERLDRWVAVKFIQPGKHEDKVGRERLRREARASARLSHPAIVRIFDMVQTEDGDGIVMELVEGKTLSQILRDGPMDLAQGLALAREIASALVEAHAHGVVHRDLKTENIVVTASGRPKILDFGLAKRVEHTEAEAALTVDGMVLGTCRSMAPEQIEGRLIDPRTDLFSFGTLLYETFTGTSPFYDKSVIETLKRVCLHRQPPARETNPRLPEELSGLIDHLLQKDPAARPQNAQSVLMALERIGLPGGQGSVAMPFQPPSETGLATDMPSSYSESLDGPPTTVATRRSSGERRQVTAVRCGLIGRGGQALDPEELLEHMPQLQAVVSETVQRFEGNLQPGLGGELHATFGYPQAHEDDARRAVHTALEIAARCERSGGPSVRIGLHTGTVVVARAAGSWREELALGDLPNLAGAVQGLGGPGSVLVSRSTYRLIERYFVCEEVEPARAWRVLQPRDLQSGEDSTTGIVLAPLVARGQELELMLERWSMAREGKGQVVLLAGEAGIGKSRLIRELRRQLGEDKPVWLELHGSPYHRNSILYPVIELLRRWLELNRESGEQGISLLEEILKHYGLPAEEMAPVLAALLSVPLDGRYEPSSLSPEGQRKRTLEAVLAVLLEMAERRPVVLAVEDLHFIDPSTLELLGHVLQQGASTRIFAVMTYRPDFQPPWGQRSYLTQLSLGPLSGRQIEQMIERLAGSRKLPAPVLAQIIEKADGVPLVIEEMVKMVLEAGPQEGSGALLKPLEIPATLRDSLMARLDRLGSAKELAQLAATLGREFSHDLLVEVAPWDETWLHRELTRLVDAELLYRRGLPPRARYVFKHGLIQDAAYESLLRSHRQEFHQRIAEVLERKFPQIAEGQPELVAHHYTEAGRAPEALGWWYRAGEKALRGSGHKEAAGHLTRALELLSSLPESPERDQREIGLRVSLGVAAGSATSFAEPDVQRSFERARDLCGRAGQTPQLFPALRGLYIFYVLTGKPRTARETAQQLLRLAESAQDPVTLLSSHQAMGFTAMVLGDLPQARAYLEKGIAFYDLERARSAQILAGPQPGVECLGNLSWVLWFLGYPDQALSRSEEMLAVARELGQPFSIACALFFAGELRAFRREPEAVRQINEELLELSTRQEFPYWRIMGTAQRGWLRTQEGKADEGAVDIRAGSQFGGLRRDPHVFAFLAEAYRSLGKTAEALEALDGSVDMVDAGQTLFQAELHRLRGELLAEQGAAEEDVVDQLACALGVARQQSSRALELRAAISLARHWAARGKKAEAREVLEPVYSAFTEGLETADLVEARGVLGSL